MEGSNFKSQWGEKITYKKKIKKISCTQMGFLLTNTMANHKNMGETQCI